MNIFTFGKLKCYINLKVIGYPCSLSNPGYITSNKNFMLNFIKTIKGAKLILNVIDVKEKDEFTIGQTLPTCIFENSFNSIKEYLSTLRSGYRRRINIAIKNCEIRVRQPLAKIMIPESNERIKEQINAVSNLICSEVNVKEIEFMEASNNILVKRIKPNFKTLGPKYGKIMKAISAAVAEFSQEDIAKIETEGKYNLTVEGQPVELLISDVEIATQDIPGWVVANEGSLTVALDITISKELKEEGIARELVNRIQNIRKDSDFEVTDKILVDLGANAEWNDAVKNYMDYICSETLTATLSLVDSVVSADKQSIEIIDGMPVDVWVRKA